MPGQLEQTPHCCNKAFVGFPRVSGSDSCLPEEAHSTGLPTSPRERCCTAASKVFLRAKKLWVNPPKAERAKPSLSSDYNLLFKNKIGESSLDIHHMGSFCVFRSAQLSRRVLPDPPSEEKELHHLLCLAALILNGCVLYGSQPDQI